MSMSYKPYNKGGGPKKFESDKLKQFLITRAVSLGQAVNLCVAGKVELKDIQDLTDKFTLMQFGMLEVDPVVDKEVLRIAAKVQDRAAKVNQTATDKAGIAKLGADHRADNEAYAADQRDQEAQERQQAEDEYNDTIDAMDAMDRDKKHDSTMDESKVVYECKLCDRKYKTAKGLESHKKKNHAGDKK